MTSTLQNKKQKGKDEKKKEKQLNLPEIAQEAEIYTKSCHK
jgi:hypothetical protein